MFTRLVRTALGPVTLDAPEFPPRQFNGKHGHLWQWVGDGGELISLSVAVRESRLVTEAGVRGHLRWEIREAQGALDPDTDSQVHPVPVDVSGADASAAATLDGLREDHAVRSHLIVTTDGARNQFVIHALVPDHGNGRELCAAVTRGIQVHPWTLPPSGDPE